MKARLPRNASMVALVAVLACVLAAGVWRSVHTAPEGATGVVVDTGLVERGDGDQTLYYATLVLDCSEAYSELLRFDQDTVSLSAACYKEGASSTGSESMEVELHRVTHGLLDDYVSSVEISRSGNSTVVWENVGAGDYYFKFVKDDDGQTVRSRSLMFYSLDDDEKGV